MRILGVDVGEKRIGLAVSDPLGITAQGLGTVLTRDGEVIDSIKKVIREYSIKEIIVGLPLNMDGREGRAARACAEFAGKLRSQTNLPVKLWDERLSSAEVERIMLNADISRRKRKRASDKLSAQIILQGYLDVNR